MLKGLATDDGMSESTEGIINIANSDIFGTVI